MTSDACFRKIPIDRVGENGFQGSREKSGRPIGRLWQ